MRWAGHVAHMEKRNTYRVLVEKPEGKRPLWRLTHMWEDNLKWILEEWDQCTWPGLIWLRIGTGGRPLWTWKFTSRFHEMWTSWLGGQKVAFQGLCSMELANVGKELFRMWTHMEG
jgi:hypothetical protein